MIVVYPMMVSSAISENTLPAISKMLEQYILVYMQDDYMTAVNTLGGPKPKLRYKFKGKLLVAENVTEADEWEFDVSTKDVRDHIGKGIKRGAGDVRDKLKHRVRYGSKPELNPNSSKFDPKKYKQAMDAEKIQMGRDKNARDIEKHKADMRARGAKVEVKTSEKTISLEPTYMEMDTPYGSKLFGIKVVPYKVISDAKLSALLRHDIQIKGITAATLPMGRKAMAKILNIFNRGHASGDPKKDIIYRTTGHKGETFVALEKNYDIDENFLKDTQKIKRLFKLGWGNFVICDDTLQIAHFCLRATKGMCLGMSYRMMYNTLKQDAVYTDLEDLRKQNSSIFKVSGKRFSKLIGEAKADGKLFNYQERQ